MICEELKNKLLNSQTLNDFREICIKNNIKSFQEMDEITLRHYGRLGKGGSAYDHSDPRIAFKH